MDWTEAVDGYCERLGPGLWAEPWNAVTNLAFILVGLWMWRRSAGVAPARLLSAVLVVIGIGSGLFHTFAQAWAGVADVVPILVFVLLYVWFANRYFWRLGPVWSGVGTALFVPYAAATVPLFAMIPGLGGSSAYAPVPVLIAAYGVALWRRLQVARGLLTGAGVLCLSILFRALDAPLCGVWPGGTHFLWHLLNAAMLGWMIEVLRRHLSGSLAGGGGGR
ncbi:membrane protein [Primorskyibacter flagellatus]|uniref:Membrane protein n=1 Tax=Primorskyibacter flagellatus TaxID=1387277 RepID=A0A916ZXI5_9RHOB|nr:ceramidase domain-containing protein [Primorskyibacter flagellatus]GGE17986.1 membrane protein [Primorskyibacter flagellatus]